MREVTKEYDIRYDPDNPVSSEEILLRLVENYAKMIPKANAITTPALTSITVSKILSDQLNLDIQSTCKHIEKLVKAVNSRLDRIEATKPFFRT